MTEIPSTFLVSSGTLNLALLQELQTRPEPFTPGEPLFWDDEYISEQMLRAHLNPNTDAASRQPATIERSVTWMVKTLALPEGAAVLDLGCGPGLYAVRLAQHGMEVTGVDYSHRSIVYATQYAAEHQLAITYRYQNYLTLKDENRYDAACLIYGDFCPLPPSDRKTLLANIHRALKPGGRFVLDVTTRACRKLWGATNGWYAVREGGFWKPGVHLVLEQGFDYPEQLIYCDQYIILEADGKLSVYRNWFQDYTPQSITAELETGGFCVQGVWGDLCGTEYQEGSEWIGVVAQKE